MPIKWIVSAGLARSVHLQQTGRTVDEPNMESFGDVAGIAALATAFGVLVAGLVRREERHRDPDELAREARERAEREQRARDERARVEQLRAERANAAQVEEDRRRDDRERSNAAARALRRAQRNRNRTRDARPDTGRAAPETEQRRKRADADVDAALAVYLRDEIRPR
jgi:hypothetical protein